ncbi:MAG: transporter permease [Sediminibacterium sp.]|nr:transporter permease [Sediminibacterium sp.]
MLTHLFKLIWNKKKQNFLLMLEMLVSFIVMFAVFSLLVLFYQNYRQPMGFIYDDVWSINLGSHEGEREKNDSAMAVKESTRNILRSIPQVEVMSYSGNNIPFSMSSSNTQVAFKNKKTMANIYTVEDGYMKLLQFNLTEGRWFAEADVAAKNRPIVINTALKEKIFGNESPLGKMLGSDAEGMKVIGVVNDFKDKGDYEGAEPGLFQRADTSSYKWMSTILVKMRAGSGAVVESSLYKALSASVKNSNIEIEHLFKKRVDKNNFILVPMIILLVVAGFLIINVALGLFGVLWYNINKRRSEIGLRRAVGASAKSISKQLVGEALVLSTISLLIGSFFAVQFPLLHVFDLPASVYLVALLLSVIFIYVLVLLCAWYPAKQAAAIYPAVALHEE